jgi:subtilisin-like proprotein convertase family protein
MKMSIKKLTVAVVALMAVAGVARATLLEETWGGTETIPDGNPVGIANSFTVTDPGDAAIQDVSVTLNINNGYNGDLYGYLVFQPTTGSAQMIVLLDQVVGPSGSAPFGSSAAGFDNVTLSDSGSTSIHTAGGSPVTTGVYTPDAQGVGQTFDNTFSGSASGTWTLFLADLSAGGGTSPSQLTSFTLDLSVVPEPITWALVGFGGLLVAARFIASRRQSKSA